MSADRLTIEVTDMDIRSGRRAVCGDCPVALAASRALERQVYVNSSLISVTTLEGQEHIRRFVPLPTVAWKFIRLFDDQGPQAVRPFTFELPPLQSWSRMYD